MLIINADDYGRSRLTTDRILACYRHGSVTSTSAMVFMEDSLRAADLAKECSIDVGLHLNFTQKLTQRNYNLKFRDYHDRIVGYLTRNNYNYLIYNPALRAQFEFVFQTQLEEFERLFGMSPAHIDGHHHMHLCANMLCGFIIPANQKMRRNFTFARGEKGFFNRTYRSVIDKWLAGRYYMTDYFFSLPESIRTGRLSYALELAKTLNVELETHPEHEEEFEWLTGNACIKAFSGIRKGTYNQLNVSDYSGKAL